NPLFIWVDLGFSKATLHFYDQQFQGDEVSKFPSARLSPTALRLAHSYGLQAYSISPKGARLMLDYCLPLKSNLVPFPGTSIIARTSGIDCTMSGLYSSMQAFVSIPPLVLQDDSQKSDRRGTDVRNDSPPNEP